MTRSLLFSLLLVPALAAAAPTSSAPRASVRRFALLVGVNDGGEGRARLRYAVTDARSFGNVLEELGGVQPQDTLLLLEGDRAALESALVRFKAMVAAATTPGTRIEALIYYSGHSDEQGLLLQKDRFGYRELRKALESLPADVRIAILDSCASGTLARQKGGVRRPAFMVDASSAVRGHAILTSSSEDEVSQESDRIGGSFFTHNLVSGLRGAADVSGDGRVTLHEAYQFAFHETLARTEQTRAGAQHPAYDIELAGTGDLVMTDLRSTAAVLVLEDLVDGRLFVRDSQGRLVVELKKYAGRTTELGLQKGRYSVMRKVLDQTSHAEFELGEGGRTVLAASAFRAVQGELTAMRGGGALPAAVSAGASEVAAAGSGRRSRFVNVGLFPGLQTNDLMTSGEPVDNHLSVSIGMARMARLDGVAMALGANVATDKVDGLQLALGANVVRGDMSGTQLAIGGNWTHGKAEGVQAAIGLNLARASGTLGQLAVGANVSGTSLAGAQLAVGGNWTAGDVDGVQGAVGFNHVRDRVTGLQVAVGLNWAAEARGAQLSLLNVGGDVKGAQVGLVNVAGRLNGLQLGLVNVSRELESGVPVGLVSIARNGQFHVEAFGNDFNYANTAIKVGSRYLYTTLVLGMGSMEGARGPSHWSLGLGLGAHIPVSERFFLDVDAVTNTLYDWSVSFEGNSLLHQLRLVAGFQVAPNLAIIGGPTLNVLHDVSGEPASNLSRLPSLDAGGVRLWPGVQVGLRI
ncbi:caspase family protein [Myxococcus sp. AM009]|uniref:caspase family protein n=1 Tax=unclassified Myxococcus TaxID=2648731 RepID=UPI001594FD30|nr:MULTISPECIES: caspase family protein [unclassified Myxococcus]NVI97787.1 caspase family protein [Myxococcus sp. AM009]NVJ15867.1 caspase family protein [Myxococcus sp. AM010]